MYSMVQKEIIHYIIACYPRPTSHGSSQSYCHYRFRFWQVFCRVYQ